MKKYYTVYKITNTITKKFYIGAHETQNINDGYMGSGVYLKRAQKKYGICNFSKEILFTFSTSEEMYAKEAELVKIHSDAYNIMEGGRGGWEYARSKITRESYEKIKRTRQSEEYKQKTASYRKAAGHRITAMQKDPAIRSKQAATLKQKMNDPQWQQTVGVQRAQKISETMKRRSKEVITDDRNKKVALAMAGRLCVTLHGQKKRLKRDDPLLNHPDIIMGW